MRFMSVMLGLLCLPLLAAAIVLSPVIVPALCILAAIVPGLAVLKRTSSKRSWNLASYHSPHSLTWRWLVGISFGSMFARPAIYMQPREILPRWPNPFVAFAFNIGIAGASASTNNYGWQFAAWMFGIHVHFHQQAPMWYRDLYVRARDEADQLSGRAWFSDKHPNKVHVPPRPNTAMPAAVQ
jgi:hypothetical protein